jgi:hypothetical protein
MQLIYQNGLKEKLVGYSFQDGKEATAVKDQDKYGRESKYSV